MDARDLRRAWAAKYAREPAPWRGPARLPEFVLDAMRGRRVLEVGAAGGKSLAALRRVAREVVAVDWVAPSPRDPAWAMADARALPFPDGAFDAALLAHVLDAMPAAAAADACTEAARVVAPGGALAVVAFGAGDVRDGTGAPAGDARAFVRDGGLYYRYLDRADVEALVPWAPVRLEREDAETPFGGRRVRWAALWAR